MFPLVALLAVSAMAQTQPGQTLTESYSVGYVMVPFTVLGSNGAPITNLRQKEVSLLVDGAPVTSDMFEKSQNAPVSFTILLDTSGSMALGGKMDAARAAVRTLLSQRTAGDDFALYAFDAEEAREVVPFTQDAAAIEQAMQRIKPYGKTAFFDALATMPERSRLGRNATRAIILLSDGIDNASKLTRADIASRLEGVAIPIYPLGLREPGEMPRLDPKRPDEALSDVRLLDEVARLTGGKLYLGNRAEQLALAVHALGQNLRAQYLIGFAPTGRGAVKYHHISLRLAGRIRAVRVRAGYRGTEPPRPAAFVRDQTSNERKGSR